MRSANERLTAWLSIRNRAGNRDNVADVQGQATVKPIKLQKGSRSVLIFERGKVWTVVYSRLHVKPRDFKSKQEAIAAAERWLG